MRSETITFEYSQADQMKAVAFLIQKASQFTSRINLYQGERRANAKSLLGVLSLGIESGVELKVTAEGDDEVQAIETLISYLKNPDSPDTLN